jgi:peptide/nickel transport system substrate-binding protein
MKLRNLLHACPSGKILGAVLAVLLLLCAGSADAAPEPGAITIVLVTEPINLDPGENSRGIEGKVLTNNILENLTEINPADSSIIPRLATSWKQIDANTWHFLLRKGVKFHDGEDFNAAAVVFSIKRLYENKLNSTTRNKFFSGSGGVMMTGKALDSHTLEIKTEKFEPLLPSAMRLVSICSPNTPMDKQTRNPIGTGPYKFVKWDAGTQVIVERFDGYWGKQPQVKKAIYVWRAESSVQAAMVLLGEADLAPDIAGVDANRPDMDTSYLNSETIYIRIGGIVEPPLNDRRFRMALNYAVDLNALRGTVFNKNVIPATQAIVPSIFGYNTNLKMWPYDPQKARQLLAEARKDGVPVDKEILLVGRTAWFPGVTESLEAVMGMYKAVGLNIKLRMLEAGVYREYQRKPFPKNIGPYLLQISHDNNKGDAAFSVFFNYACGGINSSTCDKKLDELIEKAQVALGEERKNLWWAVFKRIQEDIIPDVMMFHLVSYCRVGKRINFKPSLATVIEMQLAQITFK